MANDPDLAPACDLSPDEARRRSAILEAIGDWDPVQALAEEHQASECCTPAWMTSSGAHTTSLSAPVYSRVGRISEAADWSTRRSEPSRLVAVPALRAWYGLPRLRGRPQLRYSWPKLARKSRAGRLLAVPRLYAPVEVRHRVACREKAA